MEISEIIVVSPKSLQQYAQKTARNLKSGTASEITYYDDFKQFLVTIFPPSKGYLIQSGYHIPGSQNKPDMTVTFNGIVLFHIEAKKPYTPIEEIIAYKPGSRLCNQIQRYQNEGTQVLLTDFLNLWLVKPPKGKSINSNKLERNNVKFQFSCRLLEEKTSHDLIPAKNAPQHLQELLNITCAEHLQSISNAKKLIYPLANIAKNIKEKTISLINARKTLKKLTPSEKSAADYLLQIKEDFAKSIFKEEHEPETKMFADLFAQTIVYGAFSAWIKYSQNQHNKQNSSFNLQIVGDYLPFGSFLRDLFLNLKNKTPKEFMSLLQEMELQLQKTKFTPIINNSETLITTFYSDFLSLYDPKTAKERGVVYTPYEIVHFIIEGIDFLLKRWMNKPMGILSSTKHKIIPTKHFSSISSTKLIQSKLNKNNKKFQIPIDRLRILDPAAGTMAFASGLLHVAKEKISEKFPNQPSLAQQEFHHWVTNEFFENVYAFEILMAPYVLGHIRTYLSLENLGLTLNAENYPLKSYLMNTLMSPPKNKALDEWIFHNAEIGKEIKEALRIRDDKEIFVIMGNPPYNLSSQNDCKWINEKIMDYKEGLHERNKKILSDDYVKFIRFAQWKIEKVGRGIVAFITNSRYLDGQMFSVMRQSLQNTFDHIYIVNLHGDYRKKETGNPFDIKVGVCIAFMVRIDNQTPKNAAIHYMDVPHPTKEEKFQILGKGFNERQFKLLPQTPKSYFIDIDTSMLEHYQNFIPIDEIFKARPISGIMAGKDRLVIDCDKDNLHQNMHAFFNKEYSQLDKWKIRYNNTKSWQRDRVFQATNFQRAVKSIRPMLYRGWDYRFIVYDRSIVEGHRMGYIDQISPKNPAITVSKSSRKSKFCTAFIADKLIEKCYMSVTDTAYAFLLRYKGKSNIIVPKLPYSVKGDDLFYYIYAILHCPIYRTRYDELLRKGFPRIPIPRKVKIFENISRLGKKLANLHLLKISVNPKLETADIEPKKWLVKDFYFDKSTQTLYFDGNPEKNSKNLKKSKESKNAKKNVKGFNSKEIFNSNNKNSSIPWIRPITLEMWEYSIGGIPQIAQFLKSRTYSPIRKWNSIQRSLSYEELMYLLKMITAIGQSLTVLPEIDSYYAKMDIIEENKDNL
ncbi:type ISP restriction/modification enzyme [Candidatus Harpocratesius sp.]